MPKGGRKAPARGGGPAQSVPKTCWDEYPGERGCKLLVECCNETMIANQAASARAYRYACAYDGVTLTSIAAATSAAFDDAVLDGTEVPIILNTVRRMVNTFVAKSFANDNPAPQIVSTDGTFEQRLAAEAIDETLMAEFALPQGQFANMAEMDRMGGTVAACATGQYWVFAFPGDGKVEAELDDGLTIGIVRTKQYGSILKLCRTIWVDVEWAKIRYPKHAKAIMANVEEVQSQQRYADNRQTPLSNRTPGTRSVVKRLVRIHQGWRVQINEENPGRQLFCLKDGTMLEDEVWDHPAPPGNSWEFERELDGEGGVCLTRTVYRAFMRGQEILYDQDRAQHNMPQVAFLCKAGTGEGQSIKSQLEGSKGIGVYEITGSPSDSVKAFELPGLQRAGSELFERYNQGLHDVTGIAKAQTSGARQPGTTSGLHESLTASYYTENFADAERRLIQFRTVDRARIFIWALQKVAKNKYSRWVGDEKKKRELTGKDLDLDDSKYVLGIKPASEEKDSPKARLEKIERLIQDPAAQATAADLIEAWKTFDEKAIEQRIFTHREWTERQCAKWLKEPLETLPLVYRSPSKYMLMDGLKEALNVAMSEMRDAEEEGAPQDRLKYFEQFCDECVELIRQEEARQADLANTTTRNIFSTNLTPGANNGGPAGAAPAG